MTNSTFKTLNRKLSLATVSLLTVTTLGSSILAVSADTSGSPDTATPRSLVIHANAGANTTPPTENLDGTDNTDMDNIDPMSNVTFSYTQIEPLAGQSATTMNPNDSNTYVVVEGGKTGTLTTDETGTATADLGTTNGYYLVQQVTQGGGITAMDNFIAQVPMNGGGTSTDGEWNYNVNVYPKLDMDKESGSDKTLGLGTSSADGSYKQQSIFAGQDVTWNLVQGFPESMRSENPDNTYNYGSLSLTDQLSEDLTYKSISFSMALQDTTDNSISNLTDLTLTEGTDYTLTGTSGAGSKVVLTLTNVGIDKIMAAYPTVGDNQKAVFVTNLTTTVSSDYKYGQIGNSYLPDVENAYGTDLTPGENPSNPEGNPNNPEDNTPGNTPDVYLGAVSIAKVDSTSGTALAGATFAIAIDEDHAKNGDYIQKDTTTGMLYPDKAAVPEGVTTEDYTETTSATGAATFGGLELTDPGTDEAGDAKTTAKDYYLVETAAPEGYDVAPTPFKVTATYDNSATANIDNNLDGDSIHLPFTGGQGMIGLVVVAGVAASASLVIRRRKANKAE
ncbi:SpaH/EbpB family LPXTG-anchored major pilin [Lactococcus nasutitermitis]|uniref:SpaH/EbpB family LPXTG-anchored major pilin n=1 Tax=Lactococcus nasutitermitis TaxID=1652957 RepID=A0ABV9JC60_9LACT|nr:SpaH/EbpB family LPXTG-anchored major pilin [Lactococcus nasutitermitis]